MAKVLTANVYERPLTAEELDSYRGRVAPNHVHIHGASEKQPESSRRRREVINYLRAELLEGLSYLCSDELSAALHQEEIAALHDLDAAMAKAEPILCGDRPSRRKVWHVPAFVVADLALFVLQEDCQQRSRTVGRTTVAAHFAELALDRMGYADASREAIASLWGRLNNRWKRLRKPE